MIAQRHNSNEQLCRDLRKRIQAHRIKRLGWSDYVFYYVMAGLGYGDSLSALDLDQLRKLWRCISEYKRDPAYKYDKLGRYMYKLQKAAGWSDLTMRQYLTIHYNKTHWNLLDNDERKEVIQTLKTIIKGEEV